MIFNITLITILLCTIYLISNIILTIYGPILYLKNDDHIPNYDNHAVCINLYDQKKKYKLFIDDSKHTGLNIQRFEAIDTRNNKYMKYINKIDKKAYERLQMTIVTGKRVDHSHLTPGAVGCYLSHMNVYMYALSKGYKNIFIFEDDAKFPIAFKYRFKNYMKHAPEDYDILLFGWINLGYIDHINKYWNRLYNFWLLHGYIISESGMKKLLKYGYQNIDVQLDSLISRHTNDIKVYAVNSPRFIRQGNIIDSTTYQTTIQLYPVYESFINIH